MKNSRLILIEKYLDSSCALDELRQIKELVESDTEFRLTLAEALRVRGLIQSKEFDDYETLVDRVELNIEALDSTAFESNVINQVKFKRVEQKRRFFYLALAAQFLILPILWFAFKNDAVKPVYIGKLISKDGAAFVVRNNSKLQITENFDICSGDQLFVEEESEASFVFNDGTTIDFSSGSYASLVENQQGKRLTLYSGEIDADVMKQPLNKPLMIFTEHAEAEVVGTKFKFSSSDYSSLLDVKDGAVKMTRLQDKRSVMVKERQYAVTGNQNEEFTAELSGDPVYRSELLTRNMTRRFINVEADISGAKKLYLVVQNGGDNNRFDHAVWIAPKLLGPAGELDLTQKKWSQAKSGCFSNQINKGFWGQPIKVAGKSFEQGLATHATSVISYDIPEGYTRFHSSAAILDSGYNQFESCSSMIFEVYTEMPSKNLERLLIRRHHY